MISLNTRAVGFTGLFFGAGAILAAVAAFFKLLSDPAYLLGLYWAIAHVRMHRAGPADQQILAQLCAALFAILGAIVVAVVAAYLGRPYTVKPPPPGVAAIAEIKKAA